jgi:hypothetical protein
MTRATISIPEDLEALRIGICNSVEWHAFEQESQRCAAWEATVCLRGTLGQRALPARCAGAFRDAARGVWVPNAWLLARGASELRWPPAERDPELPSEVKKKVSRRVSASGHTKQRRRRGARGAHRGAAAAQDRAAISLLRIAPRGLEIDGRRISGSHPSPDETSDNHYRNERSIDEQLQELCQSICWLDTPWNRTPPLIHMDYWISPPRGRRPSGGCFARIVRWSCARGLLPIERTSPEISTSCNANSNSLESRTDLEQAST